MDVGSPFDHPRSGILYVARHLPPPGRDGLAPQYLDEICELVTAAGGRTLGLFSSMRAAKQAAAELRERIDFPLLCQGEDPTSQLIARFADDEATCLFGTLSLWQGVDVPGRSLQLVIIDRIPFPRPDDPLASARQRAVEARGGNGFMTVAAAQAGLLLAQGTGRLLRTMSDRGVVAILDPRLVTKRYGGFLRASLPPFWATTDPEVVRGALRRLAGLAVARAQAGTGFAVGPVVHRLAVPAGRSQQAVVGQAEAARHALRRGVVLVNPGDQRQVRIDGLRRALGGPGQLGRVAVAPETGIQEVEEVPESGAALGAPDPDHLRGRPEPDRPVTEPDDVPAAAEALDPGAGALRGLLQPPGNVVGMHRIGGKAVQGIDVGLGDRAKVQAVGQHVPVPGGAGHRRCDGSVVAGSGPDVDARFHCVPVDRREFVRSE